MSLPSLDANSISSIGLSLDIAGVVLLYRFGLPSDAGHPSGGNTVVWPMADGDARARRHKHYEMASRAALVLLVLGFLLQIISNWM